MMMMMYGTHILQINAHIVLKCVLQCHQKRSFTRLQPIVVVCMSNSPFHTCGAIILTIEQCGNLLLHTLTILCAIIGLLFHKCKE